MRWPWSKPADDPASGECQHSFSNWSAPTEIEVTSFGYIGTSTQRAGWVQDRHCLKCNIYERRCT